MFRPGIDDLVLMGFAQAVPTLFPFVEGRPGAGGVRRRSLRAADVGRDGTGDRRGPAKFIGHVTDQPRHTQQVDYFIYEHDLRAREIPAGLARARPAGAA